MSVDFDPWRLQLAREAQGLKKVDLAKTVDVTAAAISQFEHGSARPSPATLKRLALALDIPVTFLARRPAIIRDNPTATPFFRSLRSTPQVERTKARARTLLVREVSAVLEREVALPPVLLPSEFYVEEDTPSEEVELRAAQARATLGIPAGPIANVVRLAESLGVVVSRLRVEDERVSAFSAWIDGRPVMMLSSDKNDAARSRFDAAHELAHLMLHPEPEAGNARLERQADAFAAALLMPGREIAASLPRRFSVEAFLELKHVWGVSIAALLYHARSLGVMTESAYKRAVVAMSSQFGRRHEPGDLGPAERAIMLRRAAELAMPDDPIRHLAQAAHLHQVTIAEMLDDPLVEPRALTAEVLLQDPRR